MDQPPPKGFSDASLSSPASPDVSPGVVAAAAAVTAAEQQPAGVVQPDGGLVWRIRNAAALQIFRHRNFRLFFFGQLISLTGTWMQSTALQWLVYRLTNSQTSLGLITFISFIPVLFFSLWMGVLVDRFPKRQLLLMTQTVFMILAGVLAFLTFTGVVEYWHLVVIALMSGMINALDMPARQAFYVEIADRKEIVTAIGLNSAVFNGARIIGPAVAGILVALVGEAMAFGINAVSYIAMIAALFLMNLTLPKGPARRKAGLSDLTQGIRYMISEKRIFSLVLMVALFSFFGAPYLTLLPVFARDILGTGASGYGQLMSAQGFGALIGALWLVMRGQGKGKGTFLMITRSLSGFAVLGLALSRSPWLSMLCLVLAGFAYISQNVVSNSLIQLIVPDELRGRVVSAFTWALGGFFPLGSLVFGFIGDQIGAPATAVIMAVVCMLLAVGNWVIFPEMKEL